VTRGGQETRGPPRVHNNGFYHTPPPLWILQNYGTYFPLPTAGEGTEGTETKVGATTSTSTADTDSWTKLRRLHHYQSEHVSACLGSAAMWGGYDDDSILRLTRGD
jgi:hypothetical protein